MSLNVFIKMYTRYHDTVLGIKNCCIMCINVKHELSLWSYETQYVSGNAIMCMHGQVSSP